ncbi:MAG: CPBP family intramembrane metalloprotease [Deltaproteobacteria bacterium]|nr:MAG: CPBP family intramembrane metalloprotease [Deltaproteobacteria bacterium]
MTSPIRPRTASLYHASRAPVVDPIVAGATVALAMATCIVAGALAPGELAFVAGQGGLAVAAIGVMVIVHPRRALAAIGLRGAQPRFFVAAIAIGATAWYLNVRLDDWVFSELPLPRDDAEHLRGLIDRPPLVEALAAFALLPALCEEIVFRGVLARSLGRRMALALAALVSAAVFSGYHLSLVQALPTLTLGIVLAVIAIRADSVLPAALAHAINNAMAIAMSRDELPGIAGWLTRHPTAAALGCAATTACGIAIAARGPSWTGSSVA